MADERTVQQRILDAALDLAESQGINALTQPKIAKAAGVRQSHLTYYFPRKSDLFVALLAASHARAGQKGAARSAKSGKSQLFENLAALMLDRRRMQFFLGVIVAGSDEPGLQAIVAAHLGELNVHLAGEFGVRADDPRLVAFVDALRGMGMRALLASSPRAIGSASELSHLAKRLGLSVNGRRGPAKDRES